MAGFGDAQRRLDRLQIAHFTDQHNVGIFAQSGPQRTRKALRVLVNLTLVDQAVLVRMHELDRVFDGDDMFVSLAVDLIEHGRQGC